VVATPVSPQDAADGRSSTVMLEANGAAYRVFSSQVELVSEPAGASAPFLVRYRAR